MQSVVGHLTQLKFYATVFYVKIEIKMFVTLDQNVLSAFEVKSHS